VHYDANIAMDVKKFNNYLRYLFASIVMDVKKIQQLFKRHICGYCNGCKKINNYLWDLYANITMDVKKYNNYLKNLYVGMALRKL